MKKLLAALLLTLAAIPAYAESYIAVDSAGSSIRLLDEKCDVEKIVVFHTLAGAQPEFFERLKVAEIKVLWTDPVRACWLVHDDHVDVLIDTGAIISIPPALFRPEPTASR